MYTVESIGKILYDLDPFGTYCREFELHDEYEDEAEEIYKMFISGYGIVYSVNSVLKEWYDGYQGLTQEEIEYIVGGVLPDKPLKTLSIIQID